MKLKYKISIFFSITVAVIAIFINAIIYYYTSINYHEDFVKSLLDKEVGIEIIINHNSYSEISKELQKISNKNENYNFTNYSENRLKDISKQFNLDYNTIQLSLKNNSYFLGQEGFQYYFIKIYHKNNVDYILYSKLHNIDGQEKLRDMMKLMFYENLITIFLILIIGFIFSNIILTPFYNFVKEVNSIKTNELRTIKLSKNKDVIYQISIAFNNLVERIKTSIDLQHNFISHASHEFKNPLTTILGESEWILKKEREKEEYVKSIKTILTEAHKLETITNDLFKLANTSFKEEVSLNDKVNLSEVIIEIISEFSENVKYNYKENTDDCYVLGNMELIKIAISNIFDNCIKFSENPEIEIEINKINKKLVVVIKDNGVGIPEEQLKFIYNPFFRASNVINKKGFGIGMPLTKRILDLHNFHIEVSPNKPQGTKFQITF